MKDVFTQPQAHGLVEVEAKRPDTQEIAAALFGRELQHSIEERPVGVEGVGDLGVRRLRVPNIPDGLVELGGRLTTFKAVVDAALGDDGARAEVAHDVSDRPLGGMRRGDVLVFAHPIDGRSQIGDGLF